MSTEIITALAALCAVILGPLVSIYVVQRQTRATVLSGNRQQWINNLRDELALMVSETTKFGNLAISGTTSDKEVQNQIVMLDRLRTKIRLMLNPYEEDHRNLNLLIGQGLALVSTTALHKKPNFPEIIADNNEKIINLSQEILKTEWKRVKRIE